VLNLWAVQQAKGGGCKAEWTCALCGRQPSSSVPSMTTVSGSRAEHLPFASLRHLVCSVPPNSRLAQIVRWLQDSDHAPMLVFDEVRCRREGLAGCMQLQWSGKGGCIAHCLAGGLRIGDRGQLLWLVARPLSMRCRAVPQGQEPAAHRRCAAHADRSSCGRDPGKQLLNVDPLLPAYLQPCHVQEKTKLVITSNVLLECLCMCVCVCRCAGAAA
jgi:hypothetical protein